MEHILGGGTYCDRCGCLIRQSDDVLYSGSEVFHRLGGAVSDPTRSRCNYTVSNGGFIPDNYGETEMEDIPDGFIFRAAK